MAKLFRNPFRRKAAKESATEVVAPVDGVVTETEEAKASFINRYKGMIIQVSDAMNLNPKIIGASNLALFLSYAEVFFPIDFIASRIARAHFELKKVEDDSIVWCTGRSYKAQKLAQIMTRPNCLQKWDEFVYMHIVNKLATGNAFIRAAMPDTYGHDTKIWKWCDSFWSIPTPLVTIQTNTGQVPLFTDVGLDDIIKNYSIGGGSTQMNIPVWQILHDRDNYPNLGLGTGAAMMSASRLDAMRQTISTLKAVYDARNIIYNRCGALGILTNKAKDDTGHIAMTEAEKKEIREQYTQKYGITGEKIPIALTDADLAFLRTGMSISELQPFEETLLDAITIAGQFNIPADLVPRKDNSTYDNKASAEKGVYSGVIIPMAKQFCQDFTSFIGCEEAGYYIDCNFDDVDCLQVGRKESETVKTMVNDRCRRQFLDGLISINDWRAQIHEAALEDEVFGKTRFEMTDEELAFIERVISNRTTNINPQKEDGKDNEESAGADENE